MKKYAFVALLAAPAALAGCYTVDGVGQDVSAAGRGISHVANEVREEVFETETSVPVAEAGEPCDPAAGELAGGSGLPACPEQ